MYVVLLPDETVEVIEGDGRPHATPEAVQSVANINKLGKLQLATAVIMSQFTPNLRGTSSDMAEMFKAMQEMCDKGIFKKLADSITSDSVSLGKLRQSVAAGIAPEFNPLDRYLQAATDFLCTQPEADKAPPSSTTAASTGM